MDEQPIVNLADLEFQTEVHGNPFEARHAPVAMRIGARKLGYRVTVVPPGKRAWPYHCHLVNEEMFFVLAGEGVLRCGGREYPIRAGDFISAPPGADSAHQIINTADVDLKYIAVSTMEEPDVVRYPDSGKFAVFAGSAPGGPRERRTFCAIARETPALDYWDGEDA
jgi:uncharacterized cupin superfamily protein